MTAETVKFRGNLCECCALATANGECGCWEGCAALSAGTGLWVLEGEPGDEWFAWGRCSGCNRAMMTEWRRAVQFC